MRSVEKGDRRARVTLSKKLHPDPSTDYGALLGAVRAGDEAALEELLMRAQQIAYRFSRLICGAGAADAEDAMQEALMNVYRRAGDIREPKAFRAWLYRTVKNACLIGRRKRVHEPGRLLSLEELMPAQDLALPSSDRSPEQLAVDSRTRTRLRRALASLPPSFRVIVFLRDIEGLSTREVAQVVGISEDNVKTRLHRARLQLRKSLEER
jgi:RNA polymerase sigma-70 factor (ECF subfamily)